VPTSVAPSSRLARAAGVFILASVALGAMLAWTPSAAATTPVVAAISAGGNHTCAITDGGAVKCWGYNGQGQLGDGTIVNSSTPEDVSGLSSGVAAISAGANHTCAVTTSGGVKCWGANYAGQLGDGTATNRSRPVDVSGLTSGVVAISAGGQHTCALTSAGGVKCWGANFSGQLGDGTTTDRSTPVDVSGLTSGVVAISAGGPHTCALTSTGGVKCWGDNGRGELGDGTTTNSSIPVDAVGLSFGVTAISAGNEKHTCAVTTSGGATCWGFNSSGQLGNGTLADSSVSVGVSDLGSGVVEIDAGGFHTCGVTSGGGAKCWGAGSSGQLGNGFPGTDSSTPVGVSGLSSGVGALSAGESHSCALMADGSVECWGYNGFGQLGDGTTTNAFSPVGVVGLSSSSVLLISAGGGHTCAVTSTGSVKCWGLNTSGQLGNGTTNSATPTQVLNLPSGILAVAAGGQHTCAITPSGGVSCWGLNGSGQLGNGTTKNSSVPVQVSGLSSGVAEIAAGGFHTCALTAGGDILCWGRNSRGQLGNGTTKNSSVPVQVSGLSSGVAEIAAGGFHTCALTAGGDVLCWGRNSRGQLGNGTTKKSSVPVQVSGLSSSVVEIAAGDAHTCALTAGGGVLCWGAGSFGELGNGAVKGSSTPVSVSGLGSGVAAVSTGGSHSCALTAGGGVLCWGLNTSGQLGNGTTENSSVPVGVSGLGSGVAAIAAGGYHTCARSSTGTVLCWGLNSSGQLGNGTTTNSPTPVGPETLFAAVAAGGAHTCARTANGGVQCWGNNKSGQLGNGTTTNSSVPIDVTGL
jgi:alpha-tubulin suppressor-like RCC1 family protein